MFIDKFLEIGFKEVKKDYPGAGWAIEYKYYPEYLTPNHYTLIVFSHGPREKEVNFDKSDYRLYIHNPDGEYVSSPFQCSFKSTWDLEKKFKEVFKHENREEIINGLIAEDIMRTVIDHNLNKNDN